MSSCYTIKGATTQFFPYRGSELIFTCVNTRKKYKECRSIVTVSTVCGAPIEAGSYVMWLWFRWSGWNQRICTEPVEYRRIWHLPQWVCVWRADHEMKHRHRYKGEKDQKGKTGLVRIKVWLVWKIKREKPGETWTEIKVRPIVQGLSVTLTEVS